ncbi:AAA-like domain-containing protein [Nostoc sp. UHCC 0302]|uniref:AAA-like domain-containing protein n=1 Tax=Nostoc sp. UHCC 0302 TaxID=3134896 RepID=UPI00311CD748
MVSEVEQCKTRRNRGVILTSVGRKRLQSAIKSLEIAQNNGVPFSLRELSDRIYISRKTFSRLWSLNASVDQRTLKLCFNAFNLELSREDYSIGSEINQDKTTQSLLQIDSTKKIYPLQSITQDSLAKQQRQKLELCYSYPDGPISLDSPFYIERPPLEKAVYQEITQPGGIIRIRAHEQMGKSSLVLRLLAFARQQEYHTVNLNCYQIDADCLTDLNKLLRCLCWRIATQLGIDPKLKENWDQEIDSKLTSSFYLQNYLLKKYQNPVVLVLNEVDYFFKYPHVCQEFFALLGSWCEEARHNPNWQKLRLVLVYSTQEYISLDVNCSPLNIGLPVFLNEFTQSQVEDLASRYNLNWFTRKESAQLIWLVGGHPALVQLSLYYLSSQGITLRELIQDALTNGGIYRHHLWQKWIKLQENPTLAQIYAEILTAQQSIPFNPINANKLESLGLTRFEGDLIKPRCELYRTYFTKQLATKIW